MLQSELQYGDVITAEDGSEWGVVREMAAEHYVWVERAQGRWFVLASHLERDKFGEIRFINWAEQK